MTRPPYLVVSYVVSFDKSTRVVARRYFRSARALVQLLKRKSVVSVVSIEEATS